MKTKIMLCLLTVSFLFSSCEDLFHGDSDGLVIQNNTDKRIYHWYSNDHSRYHYPDTLLPAELPAFFGNTAPNNKAGSGDDTPDWTKIFEELPQGKFSVYFFNSKPKTQAEWDSIRVNADSVHRIDSDFATLKANKYYIYYPE